LLVLLGVLLAVLRLGALHDVEGLGDGPPVLVRSALDVLVPEFASPIVGGAPVGVRLLSGLLTVAIAMAAFYAFQRWRFMTTDPTTPGEAAARPQGPDTR
jgi:hypothetical protein